MARGVWMIVTAGLLLASPALADPGPHDHQSAGQLLRHFLTDGLHVGHIIAVLGLLLAGLGVVSVIRSARSGFRR